MDDNLEWKDDMPEGHPFKAVFDKVNSVIKNARKSEPFNFDEKFSVLTQPPYGFYGSFATMGMMAFALRPWVNKIFDMQGKPRDANALIDDIVWLFKVWDDGKSNSKLTFKFQTPEERNLCQELVKLFKLGGAGSAYSDISSLKDARFAITGDFLVKKNYPLWAIKYAPASAFSSLPIIVSIDDNIKRLTDNIVQICSERELRNPPLINETLSLIEQQRVEMKNLLNVDAAFSEGFKQFLMQLDYVNIQESEIEDARKYIAAHLESTVGYWTEEEVTNAVKNWRLEQAMPSPVIETEAHTSYGAYAAESPASSPSADSLAKKREKAKAKVSQLATLNEAKQMLLMLCNTNSEWLLDQINR